MWEIEYGVVVRRGEITPAGTDMTRDRQWPTIRENRVMVIGPTGTTSDSGKHFHGIHLTGVGAGQTSRTLIDGFWEPVE